MLLYGALLLFDSDSSDSSENNINNLRIQRKCLRDKTNPLLFPSKEFLQKYRVSKAAFKYILDYLNLESGKRITFVPPILKLAATLEILGSGGYQWLSSSDYIAPLGQSTLSKIMSDVLTVMENKLCPEHIKWKISDKNSADEIREWFYRKFGIPGIVGLIDGTHLYFRRPFVNEELYFNRKGKHSLNAMIVCDHQMRIMGINSKYGGSSHDSLVWRHSNERTFFEQRFEDKSLDFWLLGDSGYPLEPWLLTPYRICNNEKQTKFNVQHAKARSLVERSIGVYKGRWRILMEERKSRYTPEKVGQIGNVCAALHNICIHFKVPTFPANPNECTSSSTNYVQNQQNSHQNLRSIGQTTREAIANSFI